MGVLDRVSQRKEQSPRTAKSFFERKSTRRVWQGSHLMDVKLVEVPTEKKATVATSVPRQAKTA